MIPCAAHVVGVQLGVHCPLTHDWPPPQAPQEKELLQLSLSTPHATPAAVHAAASAGAPLITGQPLGTHAPASQEWPAGHPPAKGPHSTVALQPSLTCPQMAAPHAAAGVIGVHPPTQAPAMHCSPDGQVPQKLAPPHRLLVSPHTAAPHPGLGGHGEAWHDDAVPAALKTQSGVAPPQTVGHVTVPPQPSLTCPHVRPPTHAAATLSGVHATTHDPAVHC
jgi:hypothetical protein